MINAIPQQKLPVTNFDGNSFETSTDRFEHNWYNRHIEGPFLSAFMVQILPFLTYSKVARGKKEINEIEVRVTGTEARTRIP